MSDAANKLSPGMAQCHAQLLLVAKRGTPDAFSATLAGVLHRAELSIGNAYDAAANAIRNERLDPSYAKAKTAKAFREYLTVHPNIHLGGHEADTVAQELAVIALDFQAQTAT